MTSRSAQAIVPKGCPYQELELLQVMNTMKHEPCAPKRDDPEGLFPAPEGPVALEVEQAIGTEHEEAILPQVHDGAEILFRTQLVQAAHHARDLEGAVRVLQLPPSSAWSIRQELRTQHRESRARYYAHGLCLTTGLASSLFFSLPPSPRFDHFLLRTREKMHM